MKLEWKDSGQNVKSDIPKILEDFSSIVEEFSADLIDFSVLAQCNVSINTYGKYATIHTRSYFSFYFPRNVIP